MEQEYYFLIIIVALVFFAFLTYAMGRAVGKRMMYETMERVIEKERKDAIKRSRSIIGGQVSEQMATYFPNFPVEASECRFIGKPIDFIAFKGLDDKEITEVVFVEIKTGKSKLNETEKSLKDAIINKRVRFVEYRID